MKQEELFDNGGAEDWREHWVGMPEYNNVVEQPPLITATFKFRTVEDYEYFKNTVRDVLYGGEKVFDGMQRENAKNAWYPLKKKASKYTYTDEPKISSVHN